MSSQTTARCVWLVDTIRRYGRITRAGLQQAWLRSAQGDGRPLTRRTLYNHREAAQQLFGIDIVCDPATYEYYIADDNGNNGSVTDWLLDSVSLNDVLVGARDISDRVFVENVPSARDHLAPVIDAMRQLRPVCFDYHPYTRSHPTTGIIVEPYVLKLFRQRWYLVGHVRAEDRIKTYALDRIRTLTLQPETFKPDPTFDPQAYFRDAFGIVVTHSDPREIILRADPKQAKYLRALPLHHSQHETVSDGYSLFTYRMRITDDLVAELLTHGPRIEVVQPPELRTMIRQALRDTLRLYE